MRVLIAHSEYRQFGGEDQYVAQQLDLLRDHHEVRTEIRANSQLGPDMLTAARMLEGRKERRSLDDAIRAFRPDVIHLHNPYPALGPAVHLAAEAAHVPLVQTVHNLRLRCPNGLQFTQGAPCRRCEDGRYDNAVRHACFPSRLQAAAYATTLWVHRFGRRLEEKVDTFIAPSEFIADRLRLWGMDPERVVVVRNFTQVPEAPVPLGDRGLFIGRMATEKGGETLLRALALAGDPPFDLVGDGPELGRWRALANELRLSRLRFTGHLPSAEVASVIAASRYLVIPSVWDENAPLAALEAMSAGRPILASATGGLPELAASGRGRLVPPGDVTALAAALAVYDDRTLAEADGERARSFIVDECSPGPHRAGLLKAYERATAVRAARRSNGIVEPAARDRVRSGGQGARSTGPRRVLMVHSYYRQQGGEDLSFEAEAEMLRAAGYEVVTYTRHNQELDGSGTLGRVGAGVRGVWAADSYGDIAHLVRERRPDIVHLQNTFPLVSASAHHAAHRRSVPVVQALRNYRLLCASGILYRDGHVCHDCIAAPMPYPAIAHACYHDSHLQSAAVAASQVAHRALGTWEDAVDLFVAPTEFTRRIFVDAGFRADRIMTKPNFLSPDPGANAKPGRWAVFTGRLSPEKGVMTMLEAWRGIQDPPLRIVGAGPLREEVDRFIETHGLGDRIEVMGHLSSDAIIDVLRDACVAIFPSVWYETFGRAIAEAFACGVPVVASRLGAVPDVVTHGRDGWLFEPGDPMDLRRAVTEVVAAGPGREAMSAAARAKFEERFTAAGNLSRLEAIYDRAIEIHRDHAPGRAARR